MTAQRTIVASRAVARFSVLLAALAIALPVPAVAAQERPSPSANELWKSYPLHSGAAAPDTETIADRRSVGDDATADGGGGVGIVLVLAMVALVGAVGVVGIWATQRRPDGSPEEPPWMSAMAARPKPRPERRREAAATARKAATVEADGTTDTAEIEWQVVDSTGTFRAVGRLDGSDAPEILASSPPLRWPPADRAAVGAMTAAVEDIEDLLRASGWTEIEPGAAWYAKRFARKRAADNGGAG